MTGKTPASSQQPKKTILPKLAPRDDKQTTSFGSPPEMSKGTGITQRELDAAREKRENTVTFTYSEGSHVEPPEDSFTKIMNAFLRHQQSRPGTTTTPSMTMRPSEHPAYPNHQGVHASFDTLQGAESSMRPSALSSSGDLPAASVTTLNENGTPKETQHAAPTVPMASTSLHDGPPFPLGSSPVQSQSSRKARSNTTSKNTTTPKNTEPKRLENLIAMHNEITQRQQQPTIHSPQFMSKSPRYSFPGSSNNSPVVAGQDVHFAAARNIATYDAGRQTIYLTGQPQYISAAARNIQARQSTKTPRTVHIDNMPWTSQESNPYYFAASSANNSIAAMQQERLQRTLRSETQQTAPPGQQYLGTQYRGSQNNNTATFNDQDFIGWDQLSAATTSGTTASNMTRNNFIANGYQAASNQAQINLGRRKREDAEPSTSKRPKPGSTSISMSPNIMREAYQLHQPPATISSMPLAIPGTEQQRASVNSANRAKLNALQKENYIREKEEELRRKHLNEATYLQTPKNSGVEIPRGRKTPAIQSSRSAFSKSPEMTTIQSPLQNLQETATGHESPIHGSIPLNLHSITPQDVTVYPRLLPSPAAVPLRQGPEHTKSVCHTRGKNLEYTTWIPPPVTEYSGYFPQKGVWTSNVIGHVRRFQDFSLADCLKAAAARHEEEGASASERQFPVVWNEDVPEWIKEQETQVMEGAEEDAQN